MFFFSNFFNVKPATRTVVLYSQVLKKGFGIDCTKAYLKFDAVKDDMFIYNKILEHVVRKVAIANILGDHHYVYCYFNGDITPFFDGAPGSAKEIAVMKNAINDALKKWRDDMADNVPIFKILDKMEIVLM